MASIEQRVTVLEARRETEKRIIRSLLDLVNLEADREEGQDIAATYDPAIEELMDKLWEKGSEEREVD